MIPQMLGISEKSLLIGQLYGNELKNILSSLAEKADENPDKIAFIFPKKDTFEADYDQITFK